MKKLQEKLQARAKGFTLVELIVVVIIIGILAAIAIPRMMDVRKNAQIGADEATARTIVSMATTASIDFNGDLTKVTDPKFITKINDSVDVDVVGETGATVGQWYVKYDEPNKKIQVYKKGYQTLKGGTSDLVYEK